MEPISDKMHVLLRLALCGGGAALLYAGAPKLPALADRRPWLEEHRLQVIALGAAGLALLLTLILGPVEDGKEQEESDCCCDGYEPVE